MEARPIALKEWASAVKALEEGAQVLIMRKGGIVEETRDFQIESDAFFLYPTFEHQRKELLKPSYQQLVDETLQGWSPDAATVKVSAYARLVEDIEISEQTQLDKLQPFHIWTDNFTEERLKWKRTKPLHVMLLRVYRLDEPQEISVDPAYLGCKSWIALQEGGWSGLSMKPVLSDMAFNETIAAIKKELL